MSSTQLVIPTLIAIPVAIYFVLQAQVFWALIRTRVTTVADTSAGPAAIKGRITKSNRTIKSPFSRTPSVCYHFLVEARTQDLEGFSKKVDDRFDGSFVIADETGQLRIDSEGAEISGFSTRQDYTSLFKKPTPELSRALLPYGQEVAQLTQKRKLRIRETLLKPGDEIYVLGIFDQNTRTIARGPRRSQPFLVTDGGVGRLIGRYSMRLVISLAVLVWVYYYLIFGAMG